jgi:flagellar biosynthetic protein FlhB
VAKGAGYVAERIKAMAQEHAVPLVENKPLAQQLFKAVDIGATIPEGLYQAVAEILAYVYRLEKRG